MLVLTCGLSASELKYNIISVDEISVDKIIKKKSGNTTESF